ncbi:MAG: phage major capsid protein [Candidatus Anammoxibacter sp.]
MAQLLEMIESVKQEEASAQRLFTQDDGVGVKRMRKGKNYLKSFAEAAKLVSRVYSGNLPFRWFQEAMSTDDFPFLFGDILDRQLLANYQETPQTYRNFCKIGTVSDFREVKRFTTSGAEGVLSVVEEQAEYPETSIGEAKYTYSVSKYGRRIPFSWETMVNDDLDALKDIPARLGRASRRTEQKFATELYVGTAGPDSTLYNAGNFSNVVTSNPVLSISALQTAMTILAAQTDSDSEPIFIDAIILVVCPALEIAALNIMNALQINLLTSGGGTSAQTLDAVNWMKNRVKLSVDPYIPIVADTNGDTSWFLFADPNNGRPALEVGFLRGHTTPEIFIKSPNVQSVGGGGGANPMNGDFDTDSIQYKVRHVLGGTTLDPLMTVASNGSGS